LTRSLRRVLAFAVGSFTVMAAAPVFTMVQASAESESEGGGTRSPIKHTIILYQENISFDHYFGTYGHGSNGIPAGSTLSYTNGTQTWGPYAPTQLPGTTQSRTCDVDHSYTDMIRMVNHGAMDKFLSAFSPPAQGNDKIVGPAATCPTFETLTPPGAGATALANAYYTGTAGDPNAPLQNYWKLASQYTLADNFFQGVYGPSTPGAQWLVAATNNTPGDPNPIGDTCNDYTASISPQNIPNLGAEATAAGTSWAWFQGGFGTCVPAPTPNLVVLNGYSAHHDPFQYFTSTADLNHAYAFDPNLSYPQANRHQRDLSVFNAALAGTAVAGSGSSVVPTLPAISWVKAPQIDDGHPGYSGPALEDAFVGDLVSRLKASNYWKDTALVIAFDETGGWWDHVAPPDLGNKFGGHFATWVNGQPNLTGCQYPGVPGAPCGEAGLGPRMPVLVISRFAKRGYIDHQQLNTASLTKWVEWNHRLPALGVWGNRDTAAGNLTRAFNFDD
jgi:phospholipase C